MSLSCDCGFDDGSSWWYLPPNDFTKLDTNRRKRCCSCKELIDIGSECLRLDRARDTNTDIEESIWGDEVGLAPWWLCEACGEIFFNLNDIGYCYWAGESLKDNLEEYWALTGFRKED